MQLRHLRGFCSRASTPIHEPSVRLETLLWGASRSWAAEQQHLPQSPVSGKRLSTICRHKRKPHKRQGHSPRTTLSSREEAPVSRKNAVSSSHGLSLAPRPQRIEIEETGTLLHISPPPVSASAENRPVVAPRPQRIESEQTGTLLQISPPPEVHQGLASGENRPVDCSVLPEAVSARQDQGLNSQDQVDSTRRELFHRPWKNACLELHGPGFVRPPSSRLEMRRPSAASSGPDTLSPLIQAVLDSLKEFKFDADREDKSITRVRLRRKFTPRHHKQISTGNPRYDALGRTLCRILRHQAVELDMVVRADGYIRVDELLNLQIRTHAGIPMSSHSVEEVLEIVNKDPKRRYSTLEEDGLLYVRANQGHSMVIVRSENLLKEITSPEEAPVCVHGTFKCYWNSIQRRGLSRMGRNHVHFATGLPNEEGVLSGMEDSCEVLVYLDVAKALKDGMKLYMSENKVLLTEGFAGVVPCEYFHKVVEWPSGLPMKLETGAGAA